MIRGTGDKVIPCATKRTVRPIKPFVVGHNVAVERRYCLSIGGMHN